MSCGIDSLPNRVTTQRTKHGLSFNILVVGPTGIGKTTLINSLFDFDYGDIPDVERKITSVVPCVKVFSANNKSPEMKITIIETKGFQNQQDKRDSHKPIVDYITSKFREYLDDELKVDTTQYKDMFDKRVHCCIYMIAPSGTGLKPIDLATMKELHQRVCLIPVLGKSDALSEKQKNSIKNLIKHQIEKHNIEVYSPEDTPIAVAASNEIVAENGKRRRVRSYPWGKMYIEKNSEFARLKELVLRNNMLLLKEETNKKHYEKFRAEVTLIDEVQEVGRKYEMEKASLLRKIEARQSEIKIQTRSPYKRSSLLRG